MARGNAATGGGAAGLAANAARPLRDAVRRLGRAAESGRASNWMALALHLSRLAAPAPRPYHRRIARAVLDEEASRHEGQCFPLGNGDMVLLWRAADAGAGLAEALARLFRIDAPDPDLLLTRWFLPLEAPALLAYLDLTEAEATRPEAGPPARPDLQASGIEAITGGIDTGPIADLLQRQTAVVLAPGGRVGLEPLFRELLFSFALLEARVGSGAAAEDPFLVRHLARRVDGRMLRALIEDVRGSGRLTGWAREAGPALNLNLTPAGILSAEFARFAAACRETGARVGIEVALLEAGADPEAFLLARERLRLAGFAFVLDAVSHHALLITAPAALEPDLIKLDWSRQVSEAGPTLDAALDAVGAQRVLLNRADTEEALRWGLHRGIRRFQGRHIDAALAAARIDDCAHSGLCTLRQCMERDVATSAAGRAGCRDPGLLDAGARREEARS